MPIPITHEQERLSMAYVEAISAKAGVKVFGIDQREYGVDFYAQLVKTMSDGRYVESGPPLLFQVKATTKAEIKDDIVVYDLDVKAYNKLISMRNDDTPCILVVFCMPKDSSIWLNLDESRMNLSHCCYWQYLDGSLSTNSDSKRIFISRSHLLTPEALVGLLNQHRIGIFQNGYSA